LVTDNKHNKANTATHTPPHPLHSQQKRETGLRLTKLPRSCTFKPPWGSSRRIYHAPIVSCKRSPLFTSHPPPNLDVKKDKVLESLFTSGQDLRGHCQALAWRIPIPGKHQKKALHTKQKHETKTPMFQFTDSFPLRSCQQLPQLRNWDNWRSHTCAPTRQEGF
jgi:hypothetical protein